MCTRGKELQACMLRFHHKQVYRWQVGPNPHDGGESRLTSILTCSWFPKAQMNLDGYTHGYELKRMRDDQVQSTSF